MIKKNVNHVKLVVICAKIRINVLNVEFHSITMKRIKNVKGVKMDVISVKVTINVYNLMMEF